MVCFLPDTVIRATLGSTSASSLLPRGSRALPDETEGVTDAGIWAARPATDSSMEKGSLCHCFKARRLRGEEARHGEPVIRPP